ncbi:hypothetical protein SDC9_67855 [bioreactor metagenome]|uniref:Uncharacterized protein n=1 Tax=bioreactor metagenome TaxID=1076179 RepID=A0A644Y0H7_9ZZZZ
MILHIILQFNIIFRSGTSYQQIRVVGRLTDDSKNFSCSRLYRYNTAPFVHHQAFGIILQIRINSRVQVFSGYRNLIQLTVFVASLHRIVNINHHHTQTFGATEFLFIRFLQTVDADIVT